MSKVKFFVLLLLTAFSISSSADELTLVCTGTTSLTFENPTSGSQSPATYSESNFTLQFSSELLIRSTRRIPCNWSSANVRCEIFLADYELSAQLDRHTGKLLMREKLKPFGGIIFSTFISDATCTRSERKF